MTADKLTNFEVNKNFDDTDYIVSFEYKHPVLGVIGVNLLNIDIDILVRDHKDYHELNGARYYYKDRSYDIKVNQLSFVTTKVEAFELIHWNKKELSLSNDEEAVITEKIISYIITNIEEFTEE